MSHDNDVKLAVNHECKETFWREDLAQVSFAASHVIRDPLREARAIYKELQSTLSPEQAEKMAQGNERLECALRRIGLLRDYSWIALDNEGREWFDLNAVLADAITANRALIEETGARIQHTALPMMFGNDRYWKMLFEHLLRNAMQYNDSLAPDISVTALQTGDQWIFRVHDNGVGIAPGYEELAFALFRRIELHEITMPEGDGCGLAFCKRLVRQHHGDIRLLSQPGEFTEIVIMIPQEQVREGELTASVSVSENYG